MMKSLLICEGSTDLLLIQYFLEKTYDWEYINQNQYEIMGLSQFKKVKLCKWFRKKSDSNFLCICAAGGSTQIPSVLNLLLSFNNNQLEKEDLFEKIVILTDNDDETTETTFLEKINTIFIENAFSINNISSNNWNTGVFNWFGENIEFQLLPLVIPFETTGAIEDFLLTSLKEQSENEDPDKTISHIVDQCVNFINSLDCKNKYLTRRREKTKARFTSVFVVLTPIEAFAERRKLLQSIPWEEYQNVQEAFKEFDKL